MTQAGGTGQPTETTVKPVRRHQLDGLRGLAITFVVIIHSVGDFAQRALYRAHLRYVGDEFVAFFSSGLELFYVMSGVLILGPVLQGRKAFNNRTYLIRRVRRLWPPFLGAALFAGIVIFIARSHLTWYSRQVLPEFSIARWVAQLGILNFGWTAFNGAWWSLTPEVIFYFMIPILLVVLSRTWTSLASNVLLAVVIVGTLASFFLAVAPPRISPGGLVELGFEYLPAFLFGIFVARFNPSARTGTILIVLGCVGVLAALFDKSLNYHAAFGPFWAGIVVVSTQGTSRIRAWLSTRHLVWLGERSYSLFLVHFSVFYLVDYGLSLVEPGRTPVFDLVSRGIGLPLALLVAMILFWTVERREARGLVTADAFWPWEVRPLAEA